MTLAELEKRVATLEKVVEQLQTRLGAAEQTKDPWWVTQAGRFANDPVFDEIVRLGREYRESLHPDRRKKKSKKEAKKAGS